MGEAEAADGGRWTAAADWADGRWEWTGIAADRGGGGGGGGRCRGGAHGRRYGVRLHRGHAGFGGGGGDGSGGGGSRRGDGREGRQRLGPGRRRTGSGGWEWRMGLLMMGKQKLEVPAAGGEAWGW